MKDKNDQIYIGDVFLLIVINDIIVAYVQYKNSINDLQGSLFHSPFKSMVVETDDSFLHMVWKIHTYPVQQNIVKKLEDYPWSSYPLFLKTIQSGKEQTKYSYLDTSFVLGIFTTLEEFVKYMISSPS